MSDWLVCFYRLNLHRKSTILHSANPRPIKFSQSRSFSGFFYRGTPQKKAKPVSAKRPSAEEFFIKRDSDKDGRITLSEYIGDPKIRNVPVLTARFKDLDKDKDGR